MKRTDNRRNKLNHLALALALGAGLGTATAQAQTIVDVGGAGTIGDTALTTAKVPAGANWTVAGNLGGIKFSGLVSPAVTVTNTGPVTLTFDHRYDFESGWDGGAVFVSVNSGAFTYVPAASFSSNPYIGNTAANTGSAWETGGEDVFYGQSAGYATPALIQSVANLGTLTAGDTVAVEFRGGWDAAELTGPPAWEIGTVQISDAGGPLLDVNFTDDGSSGFTVANIGTVTGPWTYLTPISRFEIDASTDTADRYLPVTTGSVIDLNGASIQVVLLAGTLAANDTFTLFDLSGGTTLTGTLGSISLPPGTWDTSNLAVNGTIKLLAPALPASQLGVLDLTANGGINPNTNAPWKVGDRYRLAFYTNGTTKTESNDPAFFNDFVTSQAWAVPALQGTYWAAMVTINLNGGVLEAESPKWTVKQNTGTGDLTGGAGIGGAGEPVYVVNGTTCIARNNADIWNAWSNPFAGNATLRVGSVYYSPYLDQSGNQVATPDANHGVNCATGCDSAGNTVRPLGNTLGGEKDLNYGSSNANTTGRVWNRFGGSTDQLYRLYAISYPLTIVDLNETVPPTFVSIVDGQAGADATLGVDPIVYTVTFSEPMDITTIATSDFGNVGTATTTIDSIKPTFDPAAFLVTVTPTSTGTVRLQVNAGVELKDLVGNALDTTAALTDDTTITVVADTTAPTLASIEDNVAGGPIVAFASVTYTVTFSEAIAAASVDTADFGNGGSAPITVTSVSPTGNPAVFQVAVKTTGAGDLKLEVIPGATITDLVGNPLDTTAALPDDTTITVTPDPLPALVSIVDNQSGGPVFETQSFTYFVTFDQVIDPTTVDVSDFENGTTPALTVNAVAATSNPSVFAVHVTPGGAGTITLQIAAGAVITNVNGTAIDTTSALPDDTTITVNAGSGPARGTITLDGTASWSANSVTLSGTLDASGSDKLVVIVTGEHGNPGDLTGDSTAVTYDGVALTKVVDRNPIGGTPVDQTFNDIWYLDNPATATGAIVASVNTRGNVTAFALSGTALGVGQTAISPQASKSVVLSTGFANSIVIASHGMGGDGNTANVTAVNAVAPLTETSALSSTTNLWDGHVTAYALVPTAGTAAYSFTGGNVVGSHTIAAEFLAAEAGGGPTYATWIAGYPGVGAMTGFTDDPDGDGNGNGLENFFGTDPSVFTAGVIAGTKTGNTFTFTHPQNATPASDVTAAYTWSTDLATFTADGAANGGTTVTFAPALNTPTAGTTTVTATVTGTPIDKLFVRMGATQN